MFCFKKKRKNNKCTFMDITCRCCRDVNIAEKNHLWRVLINSSKWICNFSLGKGMQKKTDRKRGVGGGHSNTPWKQRRGLSIIKVEILLWLLESKFWPPVTKPPLYWTLQVVHWHIDNKMFRAILKYLIDIPYYLINVTPMFRLKLPNTRLTSLTFC